MIGSKMLKYKCKMFKLSHVQCFAELLKSLKNQKMQFVDQTRKSKHIQYIEGEATENE